MRLQKSFLILATIFNLQIQSQNELNFGETTHLIKEFENPIVLNIGASRVLVSRNQSQVITSSVSGESGYSYGWLNLAAIKKNKKTGSTFFYGGEDRFWLNPLGSKYTLFYGKEKIESKNWKVPKLFEEEVFDLKSQSETSVVFEKEATIENNIGTFFSICIERRIAIFSEEKIKEILRLKSLEKVKSVGFSSITKITNTGTDWEEEKGLIAPWTLGMFKGAATSIGIFPFREDVKPLELSKYFLEGKDNRWLKKGDAILFKTDGNLRSKIGLSVENNRPVIGNYDYKNKRLTVIVYTFDKEGKYLGSEESSKGSQFNGDVVNSYNNDGVEGKSTFFELETTAPTKALKNNEAISHVHQTFHFEGDFKDLNGISKQVLGVDLIGIEKEF